MSSQELSVRNCRSLTFVRDRAGTCLNRTLPRKPLKRIFAEGRAAGKPAVCLGAAVGCATARDGAGRQLAVVKESRKRRVWLGCSPAGGAEPARDGLRPHGEWVAPSRQPSVLSVSIVWERTGQRAGQSCVGEVP